MAKNKRKKYLVTVDSEAFACSLVTNPAVEELFVYFSEDNPLIEKFADDSKHMLTGVVAIPNKPIYRRNKDGEEYDIVFSAEAIEKMAMNYMRNYRQNEVTLQHQEETDGVYLVEQWIKQDETRDKSVVIGLSEDLPVGSWIQTYYVDSNDVWQRIKSGELRGLSLECALGLEEFESNLNKNNNEMINVDEMKFWAKMKEVLKEAFGKAEEEEAKPEQIEPIAIEDMEAQTPTETVTETPTVETPTETTVEEPKAEEPTPIKEEVKEEPVDHSKGLNGNNDAVLEPENKPVEEPKVDDTKHLEELINSLKEEINALKEMNTGLNKKVKEMSKEPSTKPISTSAKPSGGSNYDAWRQQMKKMIG